MQIEDDYVGSYICYNGQIDLIYMEKWNWILDKNRWDVANRNTLKSDTSNSREDRFGFTVLDESNAGIFLNRVRKYFADFEWLRTRFERIYETSRDYWDFDPIIPKIYINFDRRLFLYFFSEDNNPRWEFYLPTNWTGTYCNFLFENIDAPIPDYKKFWIINGRDLLLSLKNDK